MRNVLVTAMLLSLFFLTGPNRILGQDGMFEPQVNYDVGSGAYGMAASDLDNDGDLDIITAGRYMDSISVLLNNGDGTYANYVAYPAENNPIDITTTDINGDGYQDIAVSNYLSDNISLYLNNGDGTFIVHLTLGGVNGPVGILTGDFDGDGDEDLATANEAASTMAVFINNGDNSYEASVNYVAGTETFRIASTDLDGDGDIDIATSNRQSDDISVFLNNGDGTFASQVLYSAGDAPYGIAFVDINGDSDDDIIVTNVSIDSISVLINNGDGTFATRVTYQVYSNPYSIAANDFNGDGNLDLAVANRYSGNVSILINYGNGTFAEQDTFQVGIYPYTIISGDINGDGKPDIATANGNSTDISVLLHSNVVSALPIVDSFDTDNGIWTEFDAGSKIELDYQADQRLEFDNWIRYEEGFVGQAIIPTTNFIFDYDFNITADWGNANVIGPAFSDTYGTLSEDQVGNGIYLVYYAGTGSKIYLYTVENGTSTNHLSSGGNSISINVGQTYYARLDKDNDELTFSLFSDSLRSTHISGSPTSITTTELSNISFDNFYAINGWAATDTVNNPEWTSGWIDNINLRERTQENLVAYYPFNGNANDESGNGYNGVTQGGVTLTYDRFENPNSAYYFDGADDYIDLSTAEVFNFGTEDFTLSTWAITISNSAMRILSTTNHDLDDGYQIGITQIGRFYLLDSEPVATSLNAVNDGAWHHIVGVRDSNQICIYTDGTIDTCVTIDMSWNVNTNHSLKIGRRDGSQPAYFEGGIDDIRIFNKALNPIEIQNLYHENGWQNETIALSLPELNVTVNDTVLVPLNVQFTGSSSYSSAELTIGGYQLGLDFISVITDSSLTGDAGWTYSANETGDSLLVTWLAGSQDISGDGVFCWLKFVVNGDGCSFVPVNIETATFNTGTDSVVITDGGVNIEAVPDYGDADANGILQAYDASIILKHLVGLDSLTCQGLANAEVSCNDTITAFDASLILQKGVGLIDSLPWCEVLFASGDININDISVSAGQAFDFPINLYNGENIFSYEGVVKYDQEQITLTDISSPGGDSLSDSLIPGELHFAGASATAYAGDGSFAVLHFTANANFDGQTTITIEKLRLNENPVIVLAATATVTLGIGDEAGIPESFALHQNYPNPFNPVTTLRYDLPEQSFVKITIYDILGREVRYLVNRIENPGFKSVIWNGKNDVGQTLGAGVYLYRIQALQKEGRQAGEYIKTKKMILLK
ncbi:MAG: T9SS type A sorting domain-containing protein [Planctomycetia bacterium]|nr:T9SS type A sorting domain-containing protein [Planctomycetia bacterium]